MKRRQFVRRAAASALVGGIACPAIVRAASATTLKFVPYADLALLDPLISAFVTRNHVMMVFDTLFALDAEGNPQYQMLAGHTVDADQKVWTLTLRDGLLFHDGTPVLGRDVVASLRRWGTTDAFGQALMAATDDLSAPNDRTVVFRLKRPFALLPQALAKPTAPMAVVMPERLANTPPGKRITEMVGSGPFRFLPNERVPGARNAYAKFEKYRPREGTASFCAGPRIANFDRVEWLTTPDPSTQAAALKAGEVDWVEQPVMDLVPSLRADRNLRVEVLETRGLIGVLRFNHLNPPFDNPAIRRAALRAVNQKEFMTAVAGEAGPDVINDHVGFFAPSSLYASDAGMENFSANPDLGALRKEIMAAGYKGEKVVFMGATDVARISAICEVGADLLTKLGLNVDYVSLDWGTVVQRMFSKAPINEGGWSIFGSMWGGFDWDNPACDQALRGQRQGCLVWLARQPKVRGHPRPMATSDRFADPEGTRRRHAAPGVRRCAVHASGAVLPARCLPRRPVRYDERVDPVHRRETWLSIGAGSSPGSAVPIRPGECRSVNRPAGCARCAGPW